MKILRAIKKGCKVSAILCSLLLLSSLLFGGLLSARAQTQPRAGGTPVAPQTPAGQITGKRGSATRSGVVNVRALALREARTPPKIGGTFEEPEEVEPPESMPEDMPVPPGATVSTEQPRPPQSALATQKALGPSPAPASSFLASDDAGRIPPDTHGAVGPNHLMVVHNGRVRIQNKAGSVVSTFSLSGFWAAVANAPSDVFDPKVLYDPYGGRWMFTSCAERRSAGSSVMIGVSQTSDPTGNWNLYRVDADSTNILWADFPSIGFNKNWIVVHMNMFPVIDGTGSFLSHLYVFNKADLYAGGQGLYTLIRAENLGGTMVPAITHDANLSALYLLQNWNGNSGGSGFLRLYSITGALGSEVLNTTNGTSAIFISTPNPWAASAPEISGTTDFAPQLSSTEKIQNNDSRIQNVVYRNGSLWAVHTIFLPAGGVARSAVQWWEVSTTGAIRQRGRIEDQTGNLFYAFPSIAVNKDNDALIGYSRYSATQHASGNYSFRAGTDPLNSLRDDTVLKAGEAPYFKTAGAIPPRNRWGDFSGTVVDPSNDKDMWTIQEYAAPPAGGTDKWGTWWGRVSLAAQPLPPVLQLSSTSYSASEGAGRVSFVVTRTGDTTIAAAVDYATSDNSGLAACSNVTGVASSRCDYAASVGTLRFSAGETQKTVSIPLVDDGLAEGTESLTVTLLSANGGSLGTTTVSTVTITDNETSTSGFNPVDATAFFVRQHYIDFLGREPDAAGYQGWQDILNNCAAGDTRCDRIEVSSGFFRSEEFQSRGYFVYRFYPAALGRIPRYSEFLPDIAKVSGFLTPEQLEANKAAYVQEFMNRQEFRNRYDALTTPTAYVDSLLQAAGLPNHPTRSFWIAQLTSGAWTRAQVLRSLADSAEVYSRFYNEAFVVMQYFGYLRRDPDALYTNWIQTMNQNGGDYRVMINGFVNSVEYRKRFGP